MFTTSHQFEHPEAKLLFDAITANIDHNAIPPAAALEAALTLVVSSFSFLHRHLSERDLSREFTTMMRSTLNLTIEERDSLMHSPRRPK